MSVTTADRVRIYPGSREFLFWKVSGFPPDATIEVSFDEGTTWYDAFLEGDTASVLVAHPYATGNPVNAVVVPLGRSTVLLRLISGPEVVPRFAGIIDV